MCHNGCSWNTLLSVCDIYRCLLANCALVIHIAVGRVAFCGPEVASLDLELLSDGYEITVA